MVSSLLKRLRAKWGRRKINKAREQLKSGYSAFSDLSRLDQVHNVTFDNGDCVIRLRDDRKYYYNPSSRIDSLYSVPQIGTFEPEETEAVRQLVKPGDYCLDIGGSFGWYTVLLSRIVGEQGRVYSFEPINRNYESHLRNIELNNCTNVEPNNLAVGQADGEIEIFLSDIDTSGSLKLRRYKKTYEVQKTKIIKLDDYVSDRNIDRLDFIKIDIEGGELDAFKGAERLLTRFMPCLFVEIQSHSTELFGYKPEEIFSFLYSFGYESFVINKGGLESFDFREPLTEYNFFFKPKDNNE